MAVASNLRTQTVAQGPLASSRLRLAWAREHLRILASEVRCFVASKPYQVNKRWPKRRDADHPRVPRAGQGAAEFLRAYVGRDPMLDASDRVWFRALDKWLVPPQPSSDNGAQLTSPRARAAPGGSISGFSDQPTPGRRDALTHARPGDIGARNGCGAPCSRPKSA